MFKISKVEKISAQLIYVVFEFLYIVTSYILNIWMLSINSYVHTNCLSRWVSREGVRNLHRRKMTFIKRFVRSRSINGQPELKALSYICTGCPTKHDSMQDDLNVVLIFDIICCVYLST